MAKLQGDQLSLIAEDVADDSACGNWDIDCRPPVQDRPIAQIRADLIARARGEMPAVMSITVMDMPGRDREDVHNSYGHAAKPPTIEDVHNSYGHPAEPQSAMSITSYGHCTESPPTEDVHKSTKPPRRLKYALPSMYQAYVGKYLYWYIKVMVDGKRKSFHLAKDYDEAVSEGRKILAKVTGKEYDSDSQVHPV